MNLVNHQSDSMLASFANRVRACTACSIRQEASAPVPGVGRKTGIVFVGRNPGINEDLKGEPFVGKSGEILRDFLRTCGLSRDDIFLTNMVCCHTYNDRMPHKDETAICVQRHLLKQLAYLSPYLVVTFGAEVAAFLGGIGKLKKTHGTVIRHAAGFWLIPCYHPAYALHDGSKRSEIAYDAAQVRRFLKRRHEFIARIRDAAHDETPAGV